MTITLKPEQEKALENAIHRGAVKSVDEFIDAAIAGLAPESPSQPGRREAVDRMMAFGDRNHLDLREPISRKLLHEGHRF